MPLSSGDKLGPYEILSAIGAGGMGEVYRAKDTKLGRQVAIKVLPGHLSANPSARERLRREASAAAALDHPFICKVFEIGEERGELFLVMEFISGDTLYEQLNAGSLPLPEALRIAAEVAEALEEAHNNRFVHRDLKPANVMLAQGLCVSAVPDRKENGLCRHHRRACFYSGDQSHLGVRARIRQLARTPRTRIAPSSKLIDLCRSAGLASCR